MSAQTIGCSNRRSSLDKYLSIDELTPIRTMKEGEWWRLRWWGVVRLIWYFFDWKKPSVHGRSFPELAGFAWAGIYRSMRVPEIAAASFKNEGHFRAKGRVSGTERFFGAAFRSPRKSRKLQQIIDEVNLRHHVAGIVRRHGRDFEVFPHYETAFAYVAAAFIESIRRGYQSRGVNLSSRKGRKISQQVCTVLYQVAGMVGLTRKPKNLEAHEKLRDAVESCLAAHPPSAWMQTQAREIGKKILPITSAFAGVTLESMLQRYLDPVTSAYLFPDPAVVEQVRPIYEERRKGLFVQKSFWQRILNLFIPPEPPVIRHDLNPLWEAYWETPDDSTDARLIGAVLLCALEASPEEKAWWNPMVLRLEAREPLFRQGKRHDRCYVLLKTSEPLIVTRKGMPGHDPEAEIEIARVTGPTVLGEIGMWRGRAAITTVFSHKPCELTVLRLDQEIFDALKANSGFWNAVAAEVQRRLKISTKVLEKFLQDYEEKLQDEKFTSLCHLIRYINGDIHARLDLVPEVQPEMTLAQCVELLRTLASSMVDRRPDDPAFRATLETLLDVVG